MAPCYCPRRYYCPVTCGLCNPAQHPPPPPPVAPPPPPEQACTDDFPDEAQCGSEIVQVSCHMPHVALDCAKTCGTCRGCKDVTSTGLPAPFHTCVNARGFCEPYTAEVPHDRKWYNAYRAIIRAHLG